MSESSRSESHVRETGAVGLLEKGDSFAHILVSFLLLLLALGILVWSTSSFIGWILHPPPVPVSFEERALEYLSALLFGVIVLEVLSTLITYIKSRNLESTIKDFLVVGIISSIRKILLVGAHSSISGAETDEFVKESVGTAITIVGVLLLIGGLILLERKRLATILKEDPAKSSEPS